jgi:hypothetical protein
MPQQTTLSRNCDSILLNRLKNEQGILHTFVFIRSLRPRILKFPQLRLNKYKFLLWSLLNCFCNFVPYLTIFLKWHLCAGLS